MEVALDPKVDAGRYESNVGHCRCCWGSEDEARYLLALSYSSTAFIYLHNLDTGFWCCA
jgi:hypothetical protein